MPQLWDHQQDGIEMLRASLRAGRRRPMLQIPTGGGKTIVAGAIVEMARAKGHRVIFTVPAVELIDQTVERLYSMGISDVGVIQSDHIMQDYSQPVQVASVQTLIRRGVPDDFGLAIVDEAHIVFEFFRGWFESARYPIVGLSATPWTKGLGNLYDDLLAPVTMRQLIDRGLLSPFKTYAPSAPDLSGVSTLAGDYHQGELAAASAKTELIADIVATWRRLGEGRSTLVFAVDRVHAKTLQERFLADGVRCGYVDSYTPKVERKALRDDFAASRLQMVVNVGVLTTGVDWDIRCIVCARPTKSEMLWVQMMGRGLRTAELKDDLLILDHSDNSLRLGLVTDIHHSRLDDGRLVRGAKPAEKKDEEELPKTCPKCCFVRAPKVRECPQCGFVPAPVTKARTKDGKLVELTPEQVALDRARKQAFLSGLITHAHEKGYNPAWAAHKFKEKFDAFPSRFSLSEVAGEKNDEVKKWIKYLAIRSRFGKPGPHRKKAGEQSGAQDGR